MSSFFSRFSASFTPSFLARFKQTTVGQSVGYYFLVWLILFIGGTLVALSFVWHFSAPEKVTPILTRIPSFEFQFENNVLTKTSFSDDPHILMVGQDAQIFVSTKLTDVPVGYENTPGLYILRDNIIINQPQQAAQKITKVHYSDMKIGDKIINNALLNEKLLTVYPQFRKTIAYLFVPFSMIISLCLACFFFLLSFFWSFIVFLVSKIRPASQLTYEQSLVFVLHLFLPVFIITAIMSWFGMYFFFLPTLLFVCIFFFNADQPKGHSPSIHKK